jgi:hypothetical protein
MILALAACHTAFFVPIGTLALVRILRQLATASTTILAIVTASNLPTLASVSAHGV